VSGKDKGQIEKREGRLTALNACSTEDCFLSLTVLDICATKKIERGRQTNERERARDGVCMCERGVCARVCECVREGEKEKKRKRKREGEKGRRTECEREGEKGRKRKREIDR